MPVRVTGEDRGKKRTAKSAVERPEQGATTDMSQQQFADECGGAGDDGPALQASAGCDPSGDPPGDTDVAQRRPHREACVTHRFLSG
jgi:hypothetical protein